MCIFSSLYCAKNNLFLNDLSVHNLIYLARRGGVYNFYYRDVLIYFKVVDKFNFLRRRSIYL